MLLFSPCRLFSEYHLWPDCCFQSRLVNQTIGQMSFIKGSGRQGLLLASGGLSSWRVCPGRERRAQTPNHNRGTSCACSPTRSVFQAGVAGEDSCLMRAPARTRCRLPALRGEIAPGDAGLVFAGPCWPARAGPAPLAVRLYYQG